MKRHYYEVNTAALGSMAANKSRDTPLRRLRTEELISYTKKVGIIEQYCFLNPDKDMPVIRGCEKVPSVIEKRNNIFANH